MLRVAFELSAEGCFCVDCSCWSEKTRGEKGRERKRKKERERETASERESEQEREQEYTQTHTPVHRLGWCSKGGEQTCIEHYTTTPPHPCRSIPASRQTPPPHPARYPVGFAEPMKMYLSAIEQIAQGMAAGSCRVLPWQGWVLFCLCERAYCVVLCWHSLRSIVI